MKVALISEHASPLASTGGVDAGGQNIYVAHVAHQLAILGHAVDVFTRWDAPDLPLIVHTGPGVRVVNVPAGPPRHVPKESLLPHMDEFSDWLLRFCHGEAEGGGAPYAVLHANFFMSGLVGLRVKRTLSVPLVTTFHALGRVRRLHQGEGDGFPDDRFRIEDDLVRHSDRVVAECPQDRADLMQLYGADPRKLAVVPCGFDATEFFPMGRQTARARLGWDGEAFTVLQLGRLVPRKGVDNVIRGVAQLRRIYGADARLCIVGGNTDEPNEIATPEIARLRALARAEGVADLVRFAGRRGREHLHLFYAAADVFATTPWYEPFGITPVEAMACARPVIGARVGGIASTVVDGVTGLLVEPRDPRALANGLYRMMRDPAAAEAMGAAGRARALQEFTWEGVARQLVQVYESVRQDSRVATLQSMKSIAEPAAHRAPAIAPRVQMAIAPGQPGRGGREFEDRPGRAAVFLDKDGTLLEDVPYNVDPARMRFSPGARLALRKLAESGMPLVVVSNQAGIARGLIAESAMPRVAEALRRMFRECGARLTGFYYCPHDSQQGGRCDCRKPRPGMLLQAAVEHNIDIRRSWMVGDILDDVEAGHAAGCRTILIDNGNETEWDFGGRRTPDYAVGDLHDAARVIISRQSDADMPQFPGVRVSAGGSV